MRELVSNNPNTTLRCWKVSKSDFENKAEFLIWCLNNRINGETSLLWMAFEFQAEINVFANKE